MHRHMKKPHAMTMREYLNQVIKLNSYLTSFLPKGNRNRAEAFNLKELTDILEHKSPNIGRNK